MSEDAWAEAWSNLTRAVENARAVMTRQEIEDAVDDALFDEEPDDVVRQPKRAKS